MKQKLKAAFEQQMSLAKTNYQQTNYKQCFYHLERAHILGQSYIIPHTLSHWWMFKLGIKQRNIKEIVGQIPRILASVIFSRIWVPLGNTGGTNVNPLKPMPIPEDLKTYLNYDKV